MINNSKLENKIILEEYRLWYKERKTLYKNIKEDTKEVRKEPKQKLTENEKKEKKNIYNKNYNKNYKNKHKNDKELCSCGLKILRLKRARHLKSRSSGI